MAKRVIRAILFGALLWVICLYAFWRGGWAERLAAGCFIAATYLSLLSLGSISTRYHHLEVMLVIVDIGVLAVLMFIALRSEKFWPLWLTAMQGLTILSHFAPFVPHILPWSYYNAAVVWSYPSLIVLAFAAHHHHRDRLNALYKR